VQVFLEGNPATTMQVEVSSDLRSWTRLPDVTTDATGNAMIRLVPEGSARFLRLR
jgi:hypothetical protein